MPRVAVVTGGTRGIGAAIAKALKAAGYKVAANYGGNDEAAQKFKAESGIPVYKWDVSSYEACADGLKQVEADLGPIEVLVNNAGITRDAVLHRMKPEQWTEVISTNLNSLFNMCRPLIEGMRARKFGRIINISSINGQKGQMGQTNYSAAKAGEIGFTKALAQESAKSGITVNAICPGYINTEMVQAVPKDVLEKSILPTIPIGRLGEPEEVARCVVFLASDDAGLITGSTLTANGGQYITLGLFGLPSLRRQFEFFEGKAGRDGATDERPVAERLRRLPGVRRHDRLRALAAGKIAAQHHTFAAAVLRRVPSPGYLVGGPVWSALPGNQNTDFADLHQLALGAALGQVAELDPDGRPLRDEQSQPVTSVGAWEHGVLALNWTNQPSPATFGDLEQVLAGALPPGSRFRLPDRLYDLFGRAFHRPDRPGPGQRPARPRRRSRKPIPARAGTHLHAAAAARLRPEIAGTPRARAGASTGQRLDVGPPARFSTRPARRGLPLQLRVRRRVRRPDHDRTGRHHAIPVDRVAKNWTLRRTISIQARYCAKTKTVLRLAYARSSS